MFEKIFLALQVVQNLSGLRRDMIANAEGYKTSADVASTAIVADRDAGEYLRRLGWHESLSVAEKVKLVDGIGALGGVTEKQHDDEIVALKAIATSLRDANKNNRAQLNAAADGVLASLPRHTRLWS